VYLVFPGDFSFNFFFKWGSIGLAASLGVFWLSKYIYVYIAVLATVTGFCFANSLEIIFLYKYEYSYYMEYIIAIVTCIIVSYIFMTNIFNTLYSFIGAYFLIRGVVLILWNNQIAEMKQFLHSNGYNDMMDFWMPIY
jgi:hypothetical protein